MRVVATGGFRGRNVRVVWSDEAPIEGPRDVLMTLNTVAVDNIGYELGHPGQETIAYDHLRTHYGFVFLARQLIGSTAYPLKLDTPDPLEIYQYGRDLYEDEEEDDEECAL